MKIGQASSGIIDSGSISSDGHITCYNVVIVNREKRKALMCHVWEGGHNGFSFSQMENLKRFSSELGDKVAFIVEGTRSSPSIGVVRELQKRDIEVLPVKKLKTDGARWNVDFDLEQQRITVTDEYGKLNYQETPFPPFVETPKSERGLSDQERILQKLSQHIDPETKELTPKAQEEFKRILELPNPNDFGSRVSGAVLNSCVNQRAIVAGFDNYHDYFEANPNNFTNVAPDSPELVLRKIMGGAGKSRFEKVGVDFDTVKMTPQAVMELLKDFPELLIRYTKSLGTVTELTQVH